MRAQVAWAHAGAAYGGHSDQDVSDGTRSGVQQQLPSSVVYCPAPGRRV